MARIKHIAIATQDPDKTARFYREGLGLKEVGKVDSPLAVGYYLSDGYINLAVLRFKNDDSATTEGAPKMCKKMPGFCGRLLAARRPLNSS